MKSGGFWFFVEEIHKMKLGKLVERIMLGLEF